MLTVRVRETSRRFLFDAPGQLRGWENAAEKRVDWAGPPTPGAARLAFDGVHVISPGIFPKITETGAFSINRAYLRLAGLGEKIVAFHADRYSWRDIGSVEKLEAARRIS